MPSSYQQGCIDVVVLDDRLTGDVSDELIGLLNNVLRGGLPQVVIDLSNVRLADSEGLECLCEFQEKCAARGGDLRLAAPRPLISDVLRVTGVDEKVLVSDDVIAAAGEFAL
ncbi:MAG: STAS domain-containing protein [Planctomycetales bacterium]|nr:STAS domain-containing protein [Planctomycetales bacterium]